MTSLLRSLSRNLYDEGKIVTEPNDTYTEVLPTPDHVPTGHVYVAKTRSTDESLNGFSNLHKIGYTSQIPTARVASAESQSTFFYSPADLVDSYEMPNEYAKLLEKILHQFFSEVRVDVQFEDGPVATEWFDVPSQAVTEAIELVQTGQLTNYRYNPSTQKIVIA